MLEATPPPVYRTTLTSSVGTAMLAALLVGGIDVALTLSQSDGVRPAQAFYFAGIALVLYLATGALIGLLEGTIAGAIRATHPGAGFFSRLVATTSLRRFALQTIGRPAPRGTRDSIISGTAPDRRRPSVPIAQVCQGVRGARSVTEWLDRR